MGPALTIPELIDVEAPERPVDQFAGLLGATGADVLTTATADAHRLFAGRTIWNINSTAQGGGVAEMLQSLVPYARGAGVDARWTVVGGDAQFFEITKRVHNNLHGSAGDGGALDSTARAHYDAVLRINAERLLHRMRAGDVVILHDPQTAGLVPLLRGRVAGIVWRCHVGVDTPNDVTRSAWEFLRGDVVQADVCVFSCRSFVWEGLDGTEIAIIAPSIDPFAVKNMELAPDDVITIVRAAGLEAAQPPGTAQFTRADGSTGTVTRRAQLGPSGPVPPDASLVVQISRWDQLKDPCGVLQGFVDHIAPRTAAHLVLAGPSVEDVTDDPEGIEVLQDVRARWRRLPPDMAARVHLATLPMDDPEENAVIVNALQRRAAVVVQKSLAEGFGLTVAEAMWKARPVVASRLGGIVDQIEDGESGLLVDPKDLAAFGDAVVGLLQDPERAAAMGRAAQERVRQAFLGSRHLEQYLDLLRGLVAAPAR